MDHLLTCGLLTTVSSSTMFLTSKLERMLLLFFCIIIYSCKCASTPVSPVSPLSPLPPALARKKPSAETKQIRIDPVSQCWMLIKTLPSFQWNSPSFTRSSLNTATGWFGNEHIKRMLAERCVARYVEMMDQNTRNIKIANKSLECQNDPLDFMTGNSTKKRLIIMDLDETWLDQKFRKTGPWVFTPRPKDWRRCTQYISVQNIKDLNFGLHGSMNGGEELMEFGYLSVFRNGIMHFIHQHRDSAHFIIYQLADPAYIFTHLVLIEMYYNFVYQFAVDPKRFGAKKGKQTDYELFEFDYVIGGKETLKGQLEPQKAFNSLIKVVGDIRKFDKVFIIDDAGSKGWVNKIPKKLLTDDRKVFAIQPTKFNIQAELSWNMQYFMDMSVKQKKDENCLDWISYFVWQSSKITVNPANYSLVWLDPPKMLKLIKVVQDIGVAVM